jgi:hypothetical protein
MIFGKDLLTHAVIASEAKQSRGTSGALRPLDCFVASLLAMTVAVRLDRIAP